MTYQFKPGSYIKADAQAAGEMCERLAAEGRLTAGDLVEANRPEDAPLHKAFEWDNDVAGARWREHQARHIIGGLEIRTETQEPVRAFFNIVRQEPEYRHIDSILRSEDQTEKLLKSALAELSAIQRKYAQLEALAGVYRAIGEVKEAAGWA